MPNHTPRDSQKQAERCRRFAENSTDRVLVRQLLDLAEEFEAEAKQKPMMPHAGKFEQLRRATTLFLPK